MKFEWNRKGNTIAAYCFIVLGLCIVLYHLLDNFTSVSDWLYRLVDPIFPIFYGVALAYLLDPIMNWWEKLLRRSKRIARFSPSRFRGLSLFLTYLLTFAVIITFAVIVLPQVGESIATIASQIQAYVNSAERLVSQLLENIPEGLIPQHYIDQASDMVGEVVSNLILLVGSSAPAILGFAYDTGNVIIRGVMGLIVSVYLLFSKEKFLAQLRKVLFAFFPKAKVQRLGELSSTADLMFGQFIVGKIIDSTIIGILCFIGLSIIQMPNTVLVSFIVGVTNVIPYFGPFLGAIPSFFLIAFVSPVKGLIFLVFILVLQQLDGNVIGPMILGDSTGLSAFWVIFAILFFGGVFGVFGMFIGVPTFGVIYWLIRHLVTNRLTEKNMPTDTESYMRELCDAPPSLSDAPSDAD